MAEDTTGRDIATSDDEISLVDLIAVLLKQRKLIIVSTLGAMLAAVALVAVYPPVLLAAQERDKLVEVSMSFMLGSSLRAVISDGESTNYVMQSLYDPAYILAALRTAGYETLDKTIKISSGSNEESVLFMVRRRVVENTGSDGKQLKENDRLYSVRIDKGVFIVTFFNGDPEKAEMFLETMLIKTADELGTFVKPFAQRTIDAYERLLIVQNPSEAVEESIAKGYKDYAMAKSIIDGSSLPLTVLRSPPDTYIPAPVAIQLIRKDIMKKGILLVFGVIFMAVFAAFVLQYIESVKKDPESMQKIREALKKD